MQTLISDSQNPDHKAVLLTREREIDELIALFEELSEREGWVPGDSLRNHRNRSVYFAAMANESMVGGLQLFLGGDGEPLPCIDIWPETASNLGSKHIGHVVILVVDKRCRGRASFFELLTISLWHFCRAHDIRDLILEATPSTLRIYRRLGLPLRIIGSPRMHWGETCYLTTLSVSEAERTIHQRATTTQFGRLMSDLADNIISSL